MCRSGRGAGPRPDIHPIAPVFHDGDLRRWTSSFVHATDVGAIDLGSEFVYIVGDWGNVEDHESLWPGIHLYRRYLPETGGAGVATRRHRHHLSYGDRRSSGP